ncbi:MAG: hypothetical protein IV084_00735 [Rugosibacter sp.]|nr:hypothetical protein [Rugosibacter sp.]
MKVSLRSQVNWLVCFFMLVTGSAQSIAEERVSDLYFGMHIHNADAGTRWPEVPFGAWRLWDANVSWRDVQPAKVRWDFSRLDLDVAMGRQTHTELLLPLGLTPQWASNRPMEKSSYSLGNAAEPRSIEDWNLYVETVARRYVGRIAAYEIWNEPNESGFFSGDFDTLVRLTCNAYHIIKRVDPDARLVSPSATHQDKGIEWFERFIKRGGKGCFDVVGFHFYTLAHEPPEMIIPLAKKLRAVMNRNGLESLPIWNTESGWFITNAHKPVTVPWHVLDDKTASAYVARALILGWAEGIRRFYWYAWDNGNLGLFDTQEKSSKPAARAYTQVANWMRDAKTVVCLRPLSDVMVCELIFESTRKWTVWSTGREIEFNPPAAWSVDQFETLAGDYRDIKAGVSIKLGAPPILFSRRER